MIVVKPKVNTLFSLGIFILICLAVAIYNFYLISISETPKWYHYLLVIVPAPIGLGLLFRMLFSYKIVKVGKLKIEILFPVRASKKSYTLRQIKYWKEESVKTANGVFKELEVRFTDNKNLKISLQEYQAYNEMIQYLNKKSGKLKLND